MDTNESSPWGYCSEDCPIESIPNYFQSEINKTVFGPWKKFKKNEPKINSQCKPTNQNPECTKRNGHGNETWCPITSVENTNSIEWAICKDCSEITAENKTFSHKIAPFTLPRQKTNATSTISNQYTSNVVNHSNLIISILLPIIFTLLLVFTIVSWWKKCKKPNTRNFTLIQNESSNTNDEKEKTSNMAEKELVKYHVSMETLKYPDLAFAKRFSTTLEGNTDKINPSKILNEQVHALPYNSRYELDFKKFSTDHIIGSGNFGTVYVGEARMPNLSEELIRVAIKTVTEHSNPDQLTSLISEIKILSNLESNLNLVNMLACCTSKLASEGRIWLILEFCNEGDIKNYLIERSDIFMSGGMNSRLLLLWTYHVAKGMEYLSEKRVMHGDLSARNILLTKMNSDNIIAKIADFGLSKRFYDNVTYTKKDRNSLPWKWIAPEFWEKSIFTLSSDVWNFGVVVWEIFSLGNEPYPGKTYDDVVKGYAENQFLTYPDVNYSYIPNWNPENIYCTISRKCFCMNTSQRSSFVELAALLEAQLKPHELDNLKTMLQQNIERNSLLKDD